MKAWDSNLNFSRIILLFGLLFNSNRVIPLNLYDVAFVLAAIYSIVNGRIQLSLVILLFYFSTYLFSHMDLWRLLKPIFYFAIGSTFTLSKPRIFNTSHIFAILCIALFFSVDANSFRAVGLLLFAPLNFLTLAFFFIYSFIAEDRTLSLVVLFWLVLIRFKKSWKTTALFFSLSSSVILIYYDSLIEFISADVGLYPRLLEAEQLIERIDFCSFRGAGISQSIVSTTVGENEFVESHFSHISLLFILLRFGLFGFLIYLYWIRNLFKAKYIGYFVLFLLDSFSGSLIHPASSLIWGIFVGSTFVPERGIYKNDK